MNIKNTVISLAIGAVSMQAYADLRPEFYGGNAALKRYIDAAKQYPDSLPRTVIPKNGIDTVKATFWVEKTGHITNVSVTGTKIGAVKLSTKRLIENMPNWRPADVGGIKVRRRTSVNVVYNYKLNAKDRATARPQHYTYKDSLIDDYQRVLNTKGKWNFLYKNGSDIFPYNYEFMYHYPDGNVRVCHNGKWGLLNCNNEEILPYEFDELYYYEDGYCRVKKDNRWGLYSSTGKMIAPCRFDTLGLFGHDTSFGDTFDEETNPGTIVMRDLAYAVVGGLSGFVNRQGKEEVRCFADTMLPFTTGFAVYSHGGKMGLMNDLGKIVVAARYDMMRYFHSGLALVKNGKFYGIADQLGQAVFPCSFDTLARFAYTDDIVLAKKKGKYGLYDIASMPLIECEWDTIYPNPNKRNSIIVTRGKDEQQLYFETDVKNLQNLESKLERFEKNGKWGFKMKGEALPFIPAVYDFVDNFYNGYSIVSIGNKWGMINRLGRVIVPVKYDYINPFTNGLARVSINGKMGFVNEQGEEVIAPKYTHVYPFIDGIAVVNKSAFIDTHGKPVRHQLQGLIRKNGSPCTSIPGMVDKAFPNYDVLFFYPGDECDK